MHLNWSLDQRPAWRVTASYALLAAPRDGTAAIDLERQLSATGKARAPTVTLSARQVMVICTIKACDPDQARADALTIVDSAARHVDGLSMGEPTIVPMATRLLRVVSLPGRR